MSDGNCLEFKPEHRVIEHYQTTSDAGAAPLPNPTTTFNSSQNEPHE